MATGSLVDDQLLTQFHALSRSPFQKELARLLGVPQDRKRLEEWCNKHPDRKAQAVAIYGRLAGYSEKVEVTQSGLIGLAIRIDAMSDAELNAEYQRRVTPRKVLELPPTLVSGAARAEGA